MEELKRYRIFYTTPAKLDIRAKIAYISDSLHDMRVASDWYTRLWNAIQEELTFLPYKYPIYNRGRWANQGVHVFLHRNDIVLYEIDEERAIVYIRNVFTVGKDLTRD